jgi:putative toxin-antitoxin system antitoxin component (TIGR02293 family)
MKRSSSKTSSKAYPVAEKESFTIQVNGCEVPVYRADNFSKIRLIHLGATRQDLDYFKAKSDLDYESLAKMLNVTKATLFNHKEDQRFDSSFSERLMALTDLYSYGYSVMESREKFNRWMKTDNVALQGRPIDLADTLYGISEIKNILGRIEYGVYS